MIVTYKKLFIISCFLFFDIYNNIQNILNIYLFDIYLLNEKSYKYKRIKYKLVNHFLNYLIIITFISIRENQWKISMNCHKFNCKLLQSLTSTML